MEIPGYYYYYYGRSFSRFPTSIEEETLEIGMLELMVKSQFLRNF